MKYKAIFFDLDGTLSDPQEGIINSIVYALDYYGVKAKREDLKQYIGPPLPDTFSQLIGPDMAMEAVEKYREYFKPKGLYENNIYPGVADVLKQLKEMGFILCTASSKPQRFVEEILKYFDIAKYFDFIGGATMDEKISKKEDVINLVLQTTGIKNNEVLMVGDRKYDLEGATEMGMDAVGVLYGFGTVEELSACNSVALIEDIAQLIDIVK